MCLRTQRKTASRRLEKSNLSDRSMHPVVARSKGVLIITIHLPSLHDTVPNSDNAYHTLPSLHLSDPILPPQCSVHSPVLAIELSEIAPPPATLLNNYWNWSVYSEWLDVVYRIEIAAIVRIPAFQFRLAHDVMPFAAPR